MRLLDRLFVVLLHMEADRHVEVGRRLQVPALEFLLLGQSALLFRVGHRQSRVVLAALLVKMRLQKQVDSGILRDRLFVVLVFEEEVPHVLELLGLL